VVVQDIFLSKTAQFADVVLPAAPSLEKEGTFTNTERRIQRFYQALEPLGDSKPDWWIIQEIAKRLGADWNYAGPSEIMDEIASLLHSIRRRITKTRKAGTALCWGSYDGADTPLLV
jgi:formate dehydrogenase major subunit